MIDVEDFLKSNNIEYILHKHSAVYTCEEAMKHCSDIPGLACKNLFLKGNKGRRHFLMVLPANKQTDLKKLCGIVWESKISFASPEALKEKLGLEPGSVSPFGLLNDKLKEIEVYIDKEVYEADTVSFHPNRNTATFELQKDMFHKYLNISENKIEVIDL